MSTATLSAASGRRRLSGRMCCSPEVPDDTTTRCGALRSNADDVAAVLGEGSFGRVVRQPFDGVMRAVKYIHKGNLMHEAALMRLALESHRNAAGHVARVFAACPLAVSPMQPYSMAMVMEDMVGGSLYDNANDYGLELVSPLYEPAAYQPTDVVAVRAAAQLLAGLAYLHTAGVYHRDIKGQNVALTSNNPDTFVVKYIDFGLACAAEPDPANPAPCEMLQGTLLYMPPEFIDDDAAWHLTMHLETREQFNRLMIGHDLWALGMTLASFASGFHRTVYEEVTVTVGEHGIEMSRNSNELEDDANRYFQQYRSAMAGLFSIAAAMMATYPSQRLSADEALEKLKTFAPGTVHAALAAAAA